MPYLILVTIVWAFSFSLIGQYLAGRVDSDFAVLMRVAIAALVFIAVGPAVLAYRCWGVGVQRAGPAVAGFFINLTPLFAGILSAAFLGETPQPFHGVAFALIVGGIVVSSRR